MQVTGYGFWFLQCRNPINIVLCISALWTPMGNIFRSACTLFKWWTILIVSHHSVEICLFTFLSYRPAKWKWLGRCTEKALCSSCQMVWHGIRAGPESTHSWWHWNQVQWQSLSVPSWGPEGVAEGGWSTSNLACNNKSSEEPHTGTSSISRLHSNWTSSAKSSHNVWQIHNVAAECQEKASIKCQH